ncbi:hypothetical protein N865_20565 [Intrasporangium oryzae NRRL B-24470]|uniref:Uncharacterized protein n=1 Tax=Intrasporangium oryzae NRRL B-24470 TaxID=1386089 RepID=W9GB36_9MICO|nr:hypothetical protein [Intrasporangium oryzae]EWT02018.1 hypothetical protein N865_20565 [Intrasporangium oryzae NRRL B-24470]
MRRAALSLTAVVGLVVLAACGGGGSVTLPTARPTITSPTVTLPSVTLPTVTAPTATAPTATALPPATTPAETTTSAVTTPPPETKTQTQTQTRTQTQTQTQTVTATATATLTQTVTETPSATTTTPESSTTSTTATAVPTEPEASGEGGTTWWPWVLAALVAIGLAVWLILRRRAAQQVVEAWERRFARARSEASWVEDSLVTQVLAPPTTAEAAGVWEAAQPRLLAIDESLHTLAAEAPDEARRASVTQVGDSLARLVAAVSGDLAAGPEATREDFQASRAAVDAARRELRTVLGPVDATAGDLGANGSPESPDLPGGP